MIKFYLIIVFFCLLVENQTSRKVLVNSFDTVEGLLPHQVSVWLLNGYICGGAIISSNFVLTAAHCVSVNIDGVLHEIVPDPYVKVCAGSIYLYGMERVCVGVNRIILHENYPESTEDIALLQLRTPFTFNFNLRYVKLRTQHMPRRRHVFVGGWGGVLANGSYPYILKVAIFRIIPRKKCANIIGFSTDKILCIARRRKQRSCFGDPGSPAVNEYSQLVGIDIGRTTNGPKCEDGGIELFMNVSYYREWITQNSDVDTI